MENVSVHLTAGVDTDARIGMGTSSWRDVQVRRDAHIGEECNIGRNVFIDLDVLIRNRSKMRHYVPVVLVGADSLVTRAVPDHALAFGNPAHLHGYICHCGRKLVNVVQTANSLQGVCLPANKKSSFLNTLASLRPK